MQISVNNLTFAYEGSYDNIFEDVSFSIDTDWKLGFTGRNGRGKTTFLKLLLGKYEYSGTISAPLKFEYFPYEVADPHRLAIDVAEGIRPQFERWRLERELNLLEADCGILYRPYATLSNGERTKLLLAVLFMGEGEFLLIDEPTNHLDMHGREVVSRYLNSKRGFILVSHDRAFLDGCVDHILAINRASIQVRRGNFTTWMREKEQEDARELAENERLKAEIDRLKESAAEKSDWADRIEATKKGAYDKGYIGTQSALMQKHAKAIQTRKQRAIEEKEKLLKDLDRMPPLKLSQPQFFTTHLARLEDIGISYGTNSVCEGFNLNVDTGERIALCGSNGCGKSSVLKLLRGDENIPFTGRRDVNPQLRISYVAQDSGNLCGDLSDFARERNIDESLFKTILRKLDFSRTQFEKDMADFSDGQRKKVLLAASLCDRAHLLLWDEPLNYIDVISRIQIESLLVEHRPTILFVEHDKAFCERVATRIVHM